MTQQTYKPPLLIGGIADLLRWCELLIFTVSAPVLSLATVIAVVDLLTGGKLLSSQPNLVFAFGVALAIGIDSQLPAACERVRDAWEAEPHRRWLTLLLWALIAAWTGLVIFTALRAFSIEQAQHVGESAALSMIGIDPGLFAAQRDLLAVVLLGLSGFARVKARRVSRDEERAELERELELTPMRQRLQQMQAAGVGGLVRAVGGAFHDGATPAASEPAATAATAQDDERPEPEPPTPGGDKTTRQQRRQRGGGNSGNSEGNIVRMTPTTERSERTVATMTRADVIAYMQRHYGRQVSVKEARNILAACETWRDSTRGPGRPTVARQSQAVQRMAAWVRAHPMTGETAQRA